MAMKKITTYLMIVFTITIISCEKERNQAAIIIRDCTGTYLRIDSKDYQVCNTGETENFAAEESVIATFKRINECKDPNYSPAACDMLHLNEGWIEIQKIKKE